MISGVVIAIWYIWMATKQFKELPDDQIFKFCALGIVWVAMLTAMKGVGNLLAMTVMMLGGKF